MHACGTDKITQISVAEKIILFFISKVNQVNNLVCLFVADYIFSSSDHRIISGPIPLP